MKKERERERERKKLKRKRGTFFEPEFSLPILKKNSCKRSECHDNDTREGEEGDKPARAIGCCERKSEGFKRERVGFSSDFFLVRLPKTSRGAQQKTSAASSALHRRSSFAFFFSRVLLTPAPCPRAQRLARGLSLQRARARRCRKRSSSDKEGKRSRRH